MVRLQGEPFDPATLLAGFRTGGDTGAVVSFSGVCRAEDGLEALELEAYPGFTDREIERTAAAARSRFALHNLLIVHRVGRIAPGEAIVFVATAAAHRRQAFEAADYLMDYLKSRAPFWKKAHDAGGEHWIEPRPEDYEDAARWDGSKDVKA